MKSGILLISLAGLFCGAWSQSDLANVEQKNVRVAMGASANISCNSNGVPLFGCSFTSASGKLNLQIKPGNDIPGKSIQANYRYVGDSFTRGDCKMEIQKVGNEDEGNWKCSLVTKDGDWRYGTVNIDILRKPGQPVFFPEKIATPISEKGTLEVTCAAKNGSPKPTFRWFLGDMEIKGREYLGPLLDTNENGEQLTGQRLKYPVTSEHDGKLLKCQTVHDANTANDLTEVRMNVPVSFRARFLNVKPKIQADVGKEQVVSVNISANPVPTSVAWQIRNVSLNSGYKSPNGEYEAKPLQFLAGNLVRAELVIKKVKEEDVDKDIRLRVSTQLGTEETYLKLSNNPEEGGIGTAGIVGLVLGIPVLIILIVLIVLYARSKGMLCFKGDDGTASEKERMGTDGDSNKGAPEDTKTASLSARFHAFVDNLRSKKDKTAPTDEEAAKEKEAVTTEEKKTEEVVYTEPGFTNNAEGQVEEKKSYADVVVTKEEEKSKSQAGSKNPSPKK